MVVGRAQGRRRRADGADDGAQVVADGGTDAEHAGLELLPVERMTVAAHEAQFLDQPVGIGDGVGRERVHPLAGEDAPDLMLGKPGQHGLAGGGGVRCVRSAQRAGVDPHGMPAFTPQQGDDCIALQHGEMHRLSRFRADAFDQRLRAARQVDLLEKGLTEMEPACAQRVPAARAPWRRSPT